MNQRIAKLVFVNRFFYPDHSATSQLLTDLAFRCVEWGFEVVVVAGTQRYDDPAVRLPEFEAVNGVDIMRVSGTRFGRHRGAARLFDYVSFLHGARKILGRIVDRNTVVVAKTDPPMLGMFLASIVARQGGVLVNWLQDVFPETLTALQADPAARYGLMPLRVARNRSLKKAQLNIVIGRRMQEHLVLEGVPRRKLKVIRNWAYDFVAGEKTGREDIKAEWGLEGRFVVGHFGNLGRAHEYETILGAMQALESFPGIVFLFVGGGALLERLRKEVEAQGLPNFVHRGYVARKELPAALKVPDVHLVVLQAALEGFVVPSKVAGVAAAGKPVLYIGDPKGEIAGMVQKGRCGRVIAPGDSEGLAGAIRAFAGDPASVARQGDAAYQVYRKYYRSDERFGEWREVLNGLRNGK